jgi:hypothetical protein
MLNPILNLYSYDQNCRNNKQGDITAQVIGDELTETLDDSFTECLNELYHKTHEITYRILNLVIRMDIDPILIIS